MGRPLSELKDVGVCWQVDFVQSSAVVTLDDSDGYYVLYSVG